MKVLEVIKAVNIEVVGTPLVFAQIDEFNKFIDSFNELDYPANVLVPFQTTTIVTNVRRQVTIPLAGWIVQRIEQETVDFRSEEVEGQYLEPMRKLASRFLTDLINSELTDETVASVSFTIKPEYAFLSHHLFGVSYTMNWPIGFNAC